MAHINVSIFCSLWGPTEGPLLQRGAKFSSHRAVMTTKITYHNLYDVAPLKGGVLKHAGNLARGNMRKCKGKLKAGESSFTAEVAVL